MEKVMIIHILLGLGLLGAVHGIDTVLTVGDLGDINGVVNYTQWSNRSIVTFRGIPYAEPPVDDLRFKPPVKITSWNGTLDATSLGPACPQSSGTYDEDCLTLGVYVPETTTSNSTLLPVIIFIHGGSYRSGSASLYEPYRLLDEEDLIVVVPQFRLGFLGLFSLLNDDVPGNVMFLDQIMAMQWVQDNIEYFGGDKDRVTLYGHSSGSASVHLHLLSPLTEGLFHRTILESGSALRTYGIDDEPLESALILSDYCGCQNMTEASEIAVCMRALAVKDIVNCTTVYMAENVYDGMMRAKGQMAVVQASGGFLTGNPKELVENGEFHKLPMMGGVLKNDGSIWFKEMYNDVIYPDGLVDDDVYAQYNLTEYTLKYLGVSDLTNSMKYTMTKTYFSDIETWNFTSMAPGLIDISSLVSYKSGSYETFRANRVFEDTYAYAFHYSVHDSLTASLNYPFDLGVTHGQDMVLIFPRTTSQRTHDTDMAKLLVQLWTSFAIDGVPTADNVTWPVMSTPVGPYLIINNTTSVGTDFTDEFITV